MRSLRFGWLLAVALAAAPVSGAFHEQAVNCGSCHVTHNSVDGVPVVPGPGNDHQLLAENPSDVCLLCHAQGAGAVLGLDPLMPPPEKGGGNFVFLSEDNVNDAAGGMLDPIPGFTAGHNLVAPGHGLAADPRHVTAPGGTFPASELGCTSCHDPHGNGNFRLLYGTGPVQGGLASFAYPAPIAEGIDLEIGQESVTNHTAYHNGISDWCANCHGRFHDDGGMLLDPYGQPFDHPSDEPLGSDRATRYNEYNGDADPTGGTFAVAYLPEVPFEDPATAIDSRSGPTIGSRVMCLTCHRAHATSSPFAGRWDLRVDLLAEDGAQSGSWPIPSPYPDLSQGPLCAKCHDGAAPVAAPETGLLPPP